MKELQLKNNLLFSDVDAIFKQMKEYLNLMDEQDVILSLLINNIVIELDN